MKTKLLLILHYSPPLHGASKVGDFIKNSEKLKEKFDCRFIKIKSSNTLHEIGKINLKKFYYLFELYFKILFYLLFFRPDKIYFTASSKGFAFYRDVLLSTLWKCFCFFKKSEIFYHYHTKGIDDFVGDSKVKLKLTKFFLKKINLILLSPLLEKDFIQVKTYKKVFYLPNGVDSISDKDFGICIENKFKDKIQTLNILYLSNMIKSKGYFEVLKLANSIKDKNINFHFAGNWQNKNDEQEFFNYIQTNDLKNQITFHGFVKSKEKQALLKQSHLFIFPTRYPNEAFPLSILESLSYGIPVISTNEGSIPYIINDEVGIVIQDNLYDSFKIAKERLVNLQTSKSCRLRYKNLFTLEIFEKNIIGILKS